MRHRVTADSVPFLQPGHILCDMTRAVVHREQQPNATTLLASHLSSTLRPDSLCCLSFRHGHDHITERGVHSLFPKKFFPRSSEAFWFKPTSPCSACLWGRWLWFFVLTLGAAKPARYGVILRAGIIQGKYWSLPVSKMRMRQLAPSFPWEAEHW